MDLLLHDLVPGQNYVLQVRATGSNNQSEWSTAFNFETNSNTIPPAPPTALSWVNAGTAFVATWTKPILDANGKTLLDFKDYKIVLTAGASSVIYYVVQEQFTLSLEQNIAAFSVAQPSVTIKVYARDTSNNLSTPVTATATVAAPAAPTNFVVTGQPNSIQANWDKASATDFARFELYMSTTSGFTPGPSNLIYAGPGNTFSYVTAATNAFYLQLRQVDVFGQASTYVSGSATPIIPTNIDTSAPATPTGVTVATSSASDGSSSIHVSWTAVTSSNLRNYVVRYSIDQVTWRYITVPAGATATDITGLLPGTAYYVGVAAVSYVNTYSPFANPASNYPITTTADTTPPSTPAAPTVVSNTQSVQVSHAMKMADGTTNLEADTDYLEVHASGTSNFTPDASTLIGTVQSGGQGISVSAIFYYSVSTTSNIYWKVIAVDKSKNKSTASAQATAIPGLIQGTNIASATITDANIQNLNANKITAGTGVINALSVYNVLTIGSNGSTTGTVQSGNYNASSQTGWQLTNTGLVIYNGTIAASALQLQDSNNLIPTAFADFEFNSTYYHDATNTVNTTNASADTGVLLSILNTGANTGSQALRIYNATLASGSHKYFFAPNGLSTTGVNIAVNPGVYIVSLYAKKNGTPSNFIKLSAYTDSGVALQVGSQTIAGTTYSRYSGTITIPSGVQKIKVYLEFGPNTGSTGYDFVIDSVQIERQIAGSAVPSPWNPPGLTSIDGGMIVTGSIRSSAPSATITGQPAWSINTAGNMQIGDALIRGTLVVGSGTENSWVQSNTYAAGSSGWIIKADGTVEFNGGLFRGSVDIASIINGENYDLNIGIKSANMIVGDYQNSVNHVLSGSSPTLWFKGNAQQYVLGPDSTEFLDALAPTQAVIRLDAQGALHIMNDPTNSSDIFNVDSNYLMSDTTHQVNKYYSFSNIKVGSERRFPIAYGNPENSFVRSESNSYFADPVATNSPKLRVQSGVESNTDASRGIWYNTTAAASLYNNGSYQFTSVNKVRPYFDAMTQPASYYQSNCTVTNFNSTMAISTNQYAAGRLNINSLVLTASGATEPRQVTFSSTPLGYNITGLVAGQYLRLNVWTSCAIAGAQINGGFAFNSGGTVFSSSWKYINLEATTGTGHLVGQPYHYLNTFLVVVPAGATAADVAIEFKGLATGNTVSITAVTVSLATDDHDNTRFAEVGRSDSIFGSSNVTATYDPYPDFYSYCNAAAGPGSLLTDWTGTNHNDNVYVENDVSSYTASGYFKSTVKQMPEYLFISFNGSGYTFNNFPLTVRNTGAYGSDTGNYIGSANYAMLKTDSSQGTALSLASPTGAGTFNSATLSAQTNGAFLALYGNTQIVLGPSAGSATSYLQIDTNDFYFHVDSTAYLKLADIGGAPILTSQLGWQAISLSNSSATGGVYATPRVYMDASGFLHLDGLIKIGATLTDGTIIFTLPSGFRPGTMKFVRPVTDVNAGAPAFRMTIDTAGAGRIYGASGALVANASSISLDGVIIPSSNI